MEDDDPVGQGQSLLTGAKRHSHFFVVVGEATGSSVTGMASGVEGDVDVGKGEPGFPETAGGPVDQILVLWTNSADQGDWSPSPYGGEAPVKRV